MAPAHAPVVDVSSWATRGPEPLGSSEKLWLIDPDGMTWLWKEAGFNNHASHGRFRRGDDWAEWVGTRLAQLLGLPAAEVNMAIRCGAIGTIGRSFIDDPDTQMLVLGNVLLFENDSRYPMKQSGALSEYTVDVVFEALGGVAAPSAHWASAAEVFLGYLMLDAWIANVDRHHENWGVVEILDGSRRLAPTYDHGSSLAFLLSDEERSERLATRDRYRTPEAWAKRARSRFGKQHPCDVFRAAARSHEGAAARWLQRLQDLSDESVTSVLAQVPVGRISSDAQEFARRILTANRQELLSHASGTVR